ncbi:hypothetical protein BGX38DRAFT_1315536 [Terfezia claveryi]|nr:hypothetical protein BGX38DRAFT_1315536 [Terfezia claveryi]
MTVRKIQGKLQHQPALNRGHRHQLSLSRQRSQSRRNGTQVFREGNINAPRSTMASTTITSPSAPVWHDVHPDPRERGITRESPSGRKSTQAGAVKLARQFQGALGDTHLVYGGGHNGQGGCGNGIADTDYGEQREISRVRQIIEAIDGMNGVNGGNHKRGQVGNGVPVGLEASTTRRLDDPMTQGAAFLVQPTWRRMERAEVSLVSIPGAVPKSSRSGAGLSNTEGVYLPPHKREGTKEGKKQKGIFILAGVPMKTKYIPPALRLQNKQLASLPSTSHRLLSVQDDDRAHLHCEKSVPPEISPRGGHPLSISTYTPEILPAFPEEQSDASTGRQRLDVPISEPLAETMPLSRNRHTGREGWTILKLRPGLGRPGQDVVVFSQQPTEMGHEADPPMMPTTRVSGVAVDETNTGTEDDQGTDDSPTTDAPQISRPRQAYASVVSNAPDPPTAEPTGISIGEQREP